MTAQPLTQASLTNLATRDVLTFQFNPESLSRSKSAEYTAQPTLEAQAQPPAQYVGGGSETLQAKVLFDDFDKLGKHSTTVERAVEMLFGWLTIDRGEQEAKNAARPPTLQFVWGEGVTFVGVLKQVSIQYLMFSPNGTPLRATAQIYLQATRDEPAPTNPTSGGPPGRAIERFDEGETLASIAYKHYGDANLWRAIALSNRIDDPARIPYGTRLLLPGRADAVALSGRGAGDD